MLVFTLTSVFYAYINPFVINLLRTRFDIVTNKDNLIVHFVDVGQGDAIAINLPDGKVLLIDTGCEEYNVDYVKYLKENVLNSKFDLDIDYLILTHADMDHIGGTIKLLQSFSVNTIFMPKIDSDSQGYNEILEIVSKNCNYKIVHDEYLISGDDYRITLLEQLNFTNTNDSSQVVKVEYMNKKFLFTGDISKSLEELYVEKYSAKLDCDVLKVSHHGSNTSTSEDFVNVVSPNYAVISVGENNYGHPDEDVLNRLKDSGAKILQTSINGNIMFVVGDYYELCCITGKFYITRLSLDYRNFVLIVDGILFVYLIVVLIKKEKKKSKHLSKDLLE